MKMAITQLVMGLFEKQVPLALAFKIHCRKICPLSRYYVDMCPLSLYCVDLCLLSSSVITTRTDFAGS